MRGVPVRAIPRTGHSRPSGKRSGRSFGSENWSLEVRGRIRKARSVARGWRRDSSECRADSVLCGAGRARKRQRCLRRWPGRRRRRRDRAVAEGRPRRTMICRAAASGFLVNIQAAHPLRGSGRPAPAPYEMLKSCSFRKPAAGSGGRFAFGARPRKQQRGASAKAPPPRAFRAVCIGARAETRAPGLRKLD